MRFTIVGFLCVASCASELDLESEPEQGALLGPAPLCDRDTGRTEPVPLCSPEDPCVDLASELPPGPITRATEKPVCSTDPGSGRAIHSDPRLRRTDADGTPRFACVYRPPAATAARPRPLVVFLHGGGGGGARDVYDHTQLRTKAVTFNLTDDPERSGFFLVSVQGRNLHYPEGTHRDGHHHDFHFRSLDAPSANPDVAFLDDLIDELAADPSVDRRRIYVMGWSNGGFFGQMYAIARHERPTPGGNRVAAAAVFSAADPFHNVSPWQVPSCRLEPYPTSSVPILILSRSCDIVFCDAEQQRSLTARGVLPLPGHVVATWVSDLASRVKDPNVEWIRLDGAANIVSGCELALQCSPLEAALNHIRWPDGVADRSGIDHERKMLKFLRRHPLR
jgi:pimeloyl-ACP methyl ester carboxylesterase